MSDIRSNSSYTISAVEFNSKSLSALSNVNAATLSKIKREAEAYCECAEKCARIWEALAKNQMAGSNLTEKVLDGVFGSYQQELYSLTRLPSLRDFMKLFDADRDGCLNPDEQISIFVYVKKRAELAANNCLQVQQYLKFEALMKEVRLLQSYIAQWQTSLRVKVHGQQLATYRREGEEKVDEFCAECERQFEELQRVMISRREQFQQMALFEQQQLEERLASPEEYLKIKPNNRLKELQFQEKLVSLEERVYQALDFRKQLGELELSEKKRVDTLMKNHAERERATLAQKHQKQRKQLEIKLRQLEDKLVIKIKREFQTLKKKNNLHQMQIKRLQTLQKKWAEKKAINEPQLQRTKMFKEQRNQVLQQYRKAKQAISEETLKGGNSAKLNARSFIEHGLNICQKKEPPVNKSTTTSVKKYTKDEKNYSLCKMYDSNMEPLPNQPLKTQMEKMNQSMRKYQFVIGKISQVN